MVIKKMMEILAKNKSANLLLLAVFLTSCSSRITVKNPANRFISPEASGEALKGNVNLFLSGGVNSEVNLSKETTNEPLQFDDTQKLDTLIGLGASVGIVKNIDLLLLSNGDNYPLMFGFKYQILGASKKEKKAKGHSVSVVALIGSAVDEQENDDAVELTPQDDEAKIDLSVTSKEASLLYGYRFDKNSLFYMGPRYTVTQFDGTLETDNVTLDGQKIDYWGDSFAGVMGFMFDFGSNTKIMIEGSHQKLNWQRTTNKTFNTISAGVGFSWY